MFAKCSRYGETKHCREGSDRAFSKLWVKNCAERVLNAHLALVGQIAEVCSQCTVFRT